MESSPECTADFLRKSASKSKFSRQRWERQVKQEKKHIVGHVIPSSDHLWIKCKCIKYSGMIR